MVTLLMESSTDGVLHWDAKVQVVKAPHVQGRTLKSLEILQDNQETGALGDAKGTRTREPHVQVTDW